MTTEQSTAGDPAYSIPVDDKDAQWVFSLLLSDNGELPGLPGSATSTALLIDAIAKAKSIPREAARTLTLLDVVKHLAEQHIEIGMYRLTSTAQAMDRADLTTPLGLLEHGVVPPSLDIAHGHRRRAPIGPPAEQFCARLRLEARRTPTHRKEC